MSRFLLAVLASLALSACGSLGTGIKPGADGMAEVIRALGEPEMRWNDPDGSIQLSYPRGLQSLMVKIDPAGRVKSVYDALDPVILATIKPGLHKNEVLRILGPSSPSLTIHFPRKNEFAWDWRYQENGQLGHYIVMFDADKNTVNSTMITFDAFPDPY